MSQKIYQVDAFTSETFRGNPAAVCPLTEWLKDELLQKIALENNLSETAFYVKSGDHYEIRWFTPVAEVDLCGHATLASAHVLFYEEDHSQNEINFMSPRSGLLAVRKNENWITLNFPSDKPKEVDLTDDIISCFNISPKQAFLGKTDYLLIFDNESQIRDLKPDFEKIKYNGYRGVIASSAGKNSDFVSRFFAPRVGVNEDPVTGSAHTTLTPFWSDKLNKTELKAHQLSARFGEILCKDLGERVELSGQTSLYMKGKLFFK